MFLSEQAHVYLDRSEQVGSHHGSSVLSQGAPLRSLWHDVHPAIACGCLLISWFWRGQEFGSRERPQEAEVPLPFALVQRGGSRRDSRTGSVRGQVAPPTRQIGLGSLRVVGEGLADPRLPSCSCLKCFGQVKVNAWDIGGQRSIRPSAARTLRSAVCADRFPRLPSIHLS